MKISAKSYYGLKAMIGLAKEKGFCSARTISQKYELPYDYLEKIFQELRLAGFLVTQKGTRGGYGLARPAKKIKARDIVMALEKEEPITRCQCGCPMVGKCSAGSFWRETAASFVSAMGSTTLLDLTKKHA
jgi:Rrf2 family protein